MFCSVFPEMPSLTTLHLCHNLELVEVGGFCFEGLENVTEVKLSNNYALSTIEKFAFAVSSDQDGYDWLKLKKVSFIYLQGHHNNQNLITK